MNENSKAMIRKLRDRASLEYNADIRRAEQARMDRMRTIDWIDNLYLAGILALPDLPMFGDITSMEVRYTPKGPKP